MFGFNKNRGHASGGASLPGGPGDPRPALAFWLSLLAVLLSASQLWTASDWISFNLLAPQFGSDIAYFLTFLVMLCIVMSAIHIGRMTFTSSLFVAGFLLLSKLPFV